MSTKKEKKQKKSKKSSKHSDGETQDFLFIPPSFDAPAQQQPQQRNNDNLLDLFGLPQTQPAQPQPQPQQQYGAEQQYAQQPYPQQYANALVPQHQHTNSYHAPQQYDPQYNAAPFNYTQSMHSQQPSQSLVPVQQQHYMQQQQQQQYHMQQQFAAMQLAQQQQQRPQLTAADPFADSTNQPKAAKHSKSKPKQRVVTDSSSSEDSSSSDSSSDESDSSSDSSSSTASSSSDSETEQKRQSKKHTKQAKQPAVRASSATQQQKQNAQPATLKIDVLAHMHKGTPMLKYGKHGYPHFRQFQLSRDNTYIVWHSQNKSMDETRVPIRSMNNIQLGQTTATFQRHKAPELSKSSFSIMYDNQRKSLDLIAKDPHDFRVWTNGLKQLILLSRKQDLSDLTTLYIDIPVKSGGRRSSTSDNTYDERPVSVQNRSARTMTQDETFGSKYRTNDSTDGDSALNKKLADIKKRLDKKRTELKDRVYVKSPAYESMQTLVKRINDSLNKASEYIGENDTQSADDEIWRVNVDMQSLSSLMAAAV